MKTLLIFFGVLMIVEGIPCFAMPEQVKSAMETLSTMEIKTLRHVGFGMMVGGLIIVGIIKL